MRRKQFVLQHWSWSQSLTDCSCGIKPVSPFKNVCLCVSLCLHMLRDLWIYVFDCVCLHLNLRVPPTHSGTLPHIRGGPEDRCPQNGSITREAGGGTLKVIMVESSSDSSLPLCARCFQRSPADTVPKTKCYSGTISLCLCSSQRGGRHTRRSLSAPLGLGGVMGPVLICYPLTMTK